ncbi:hypothetical protein [Streptomyces canus]|uniref:hypothetical protein n=1 Tax=Streptomyces canus TaxID=58343 RepID=UPI00371CBE9D
MDSLRAATHHTQRVFLVVNAVPFTVGIVLSCFTNVPAIAVFGDFTLGLLWGFLQCALFVATAWWYDMRSARLPDPIEQVLTPNALRNEMPDSAPLNDFRW